MKFIKKILCGLILTLGVFAPNMAFADWGLLSVDSLDISKLVPIVVDAFMFVANGTYAYFVGNNHDGVIYVLVWGFLAIYIAIYLIKLYIPKFWLSTFGFKPEDTVENVGGMKIAENVLKPSVRALVAVVLLLQISPQMMAKYVINPFLSFGSIYTQEIIKATPTIGTINDTTVNCPEGLLNQGWLDVESCEYLIKPVHVLSQANNNVIKRGFRYLSNGLQSLNPLIAHNSGQGFMNVITGILLIITFTGCNIFMALLIIQAVFNFGMALILYPFNVAAYVAKKSDSWFDIWPAFSGIIDALKQIIVTMIACAFILCVNVALVRALFQWNSRMFVAAAGGTAYSNVPNVTTSLSGGFSGHSMIWLSCILTFFLMYKMFEITRNKLIEYVGKDSTALYESVKGDAKSESIAAASILAKVSRDRYICGLAEKYPQYGFEKHKGYGTKAHREAILEYGPCEIHRMSFLKKLYAGKK